MGYYGYFPGMVIEDGAVDSNIPILKKSHNRVRCDGCGKYMKLDDMYLMVEYSYLRSHLKEECLTRVYAKAKEKRGEQFEFAALGAKQYGKP